MLEYENHTVKLLGMHDWLFSSYPELIKINGGFAPGIATDATEFEGIAEYKDLAIKALAKLRSKIISIEPPLRRIFEVPVARIIPFTHESVLTTGGPQMLPFQPAPMTLPIGAGLRDELKAAKLPASTPGFVPFSTGSVVHSIREEREATSLLPHAPGLLTSTRSVKHS